MAVEVAAGAVVVLGGSWAGVTGEDLSIAEWNAGVECVRDRRMRRLNAIVRLPARYRRWPDVDLVHDIHVESFPSFLVVLMTRHE